MPDLSQLSDEEILRNLPDEVILQQAGVQPQTQPSPAHKIINALFAPSRMAEQAGQLFGQQLQTSQESLGQTPVGQILRAGTAPPLRTLTDILPQVTGQIVGAAIDPTNLVFGVTGAMPNRIARMLATGAAGAAIPALRSYGQTGEALSDPLSVALGGTLGTVGGALAKVNPKAVVTGEGSPVEFQPVKVPSAFQKLKTPQTPEGLVGLSEADVAKLSPAGQKAYFQVSTLRQQANLRSQRAQLAQEATAIQQELESQKVGISKQLPTMAAHRLQRFTSSMRKLMQEQGDAYTQGMNEVFANAEMASGEPISFTRNEVNQEIADKYLRPSYVGTPVVPQEDVEAYRTLTERINKHLETTPNDSEITARNLNEIAKDLSQESNWKKLQSGQPFTPSEIAAQHARDILLNLMKKKGMDVSGVNADWADWVPIRNFGLKLQTPSGPRTLINIVKGNDPVRMGYLKNLELLSGEDLDTGLTQAFDQLDNLNQQQVLEKVKALERKRLLQDQAGISRESAVFKQMRVEEQAKHYSNVRKVVLGALGTATAAVSPPGRKILDFLFSR